MSEAGQTVVLADGLGLYARIQGPPGAPWLVLLNGLLSDATMWAGVLPGLTRRFRVLTFDGRGQGRSDAPEGAPYTVPVLAGDAWELMHRLGVERPWLAGLSNGSSVALQLLADHPGACRGAVLVSATGHADFTMRLRLGHWLACLDLGGAALQFDAVAPYLWGDRFLEARYTVLKAYHQSKQAAGKPFHGLRHQIEGALPWDIRARLASIQEPVLCLAGAEDLLTPPWKCLPVAQGIPGARFELVPGVGHAYPVEDPRQFVEKLMTWTS